MKKIIIGLVIGGLLGFMVATVLQKPYVSENYTNALSESSESTNQTTDSKANTKFITNEHGISETSSTSISDNISSQPQTIEEYQVAYANLQKALIQQSKAVQKLTAENKKLTESLEGSTGRRVELADLSAADIETAKANIQASLAEAPAEYAEVLKSALESYNSGDALPDADALLRHYSDEPDFIWSDLAKAYIQNYFAAQTDTNMQLVQLNCRKTYCEIYGFYSMNEELADPRKAGAQVQSVFRTMEDAPGFSNLFTGLESASISIDSENSYLTFHNFIRSKS